MDIKVSAWVVVYVLANVTKKHSLYVERQKKVNHWRSSR